MASEQYATGDNLSARLELHHRFTVTATPWYEWLSSRLHIGAGD